MDFIRPLLMPVVLCLMFTILLVVSWTKQMDRETARAAQPNPRMAYYSQVSAEDFEYQP